MVALRPYQSECSSNTLYDLKTLRKLLIVNPTASGKTTIFIHMAKVWLADNPNSSVLVLSHLDLLTSQTSRRFKAEAPDLRVGILQGRVFPNTFDDVVISTMQSSKIEEKIDRLKRRILKPIGLIIVDEAHYILTESYQKILSYFPDAKVIGVTATPFRENQLIVNWFDKVSYSISTQELIDQGYLVKPRLIQMLCRSKIVSERIAMVLNAYLSAEKGKQAIVFMRTKEECGEMRNAFVSAGIKVQVITDDIRGEKRESLFQEFQRGSIQVLISVNVLTAGFDCDAIEAIFMPFATKSVTTYLQRIGRGLRLCNRINKKECRIYAIGDEPSIKSGFFTRMHNYALNDKEDDKTKNTIRDDLNYMDISGDYTKEVYTWTSSIVDVMNKFEQLKQKEISDLINEKKFPQKFLKDMVNFGKHIDQKKVYSLEKTISETQIKMLVHHNFQREDIAGLSHQAASSLIASIQNYINRKPDFDFQVTTGQHAGKHVKDLPWAYIQAIKKKNPSADIVKLRWKWEALENARKRDCAVNR